MRLFNCVLIFLGLEARSLFAFRIDVQWGTPNPFLQDLRSFQPEAEFYNQTLLRLQESFTIETDRTHNRMEKACKTITQPWTQAKDRNDRDYLRRTGFVKAVRITQTPQSIPVNRDIPPFTHPYQRSARGIAFFASDKCKGEPKLIIWPKQAMDMDYPTTRRYEVFRSPNEIENFWYKWAQTFEFSDFDVKKDPNSHSHYNKARPQFWNAMDIEDQAAIDVFKNKYPENAYLKKDLLGSPMGTPYHQPFWSFREIFPTRSDSIWRQIVNPAASEFSYWDIPMINIQLDHRNGGGEQRDNSFMNFVPYGLADSSRATVFEVIEQEYARFYQLIVDILGVPGKSWLKRLKWSSKRQKAAIGKLAAVGDPLAPFHAETVKSLERFPGETKLGRLQPYQIYTTSPSKPDKREWFLPPSWLNVPVWNPSAGKLVKAPNGQMVPTGAFEMVPNPNRIMYSSVHITYQQNGQFTVQTVPVVSNPVHALGKEAIVLLEELPLTDFLSQSSRRVPIISDYARPDSENRVVGHYYRGSAVGGDSLEQFTTLTRPKSDRVQYMKRPQPGQPRMSQDQVPQAMEQVVVNNPLDIPTWQRSNAIYSHRPPVQLNEPQLPGIPEQLGSNMDMEVSIPTRPRSPTIYSRPVGQGLRVNTGADLRTGRPVESMVEEYKLVPDPSSVTAGSLSSLAESLIDEVNQQRAADMDIEQTSNLVDALRVPVIRRPSKEEQQLRIEKLADSQVSYRPPQDLLESTNSLLQSRRRPIPSEVQFLQDSVVNYRPPPEQNLRENVLLASQHPSINGDIVIPVGDANGLMESLVINSKEPRRRSTASSKSSGTGKKENCIVPPADTQVARNVCSALICCNPVN
ncbi:hypothetical protein H072_3846 [Dactylellina haptotyla CBS 200.50]|uniref:Uncharacterized protein n=1 Tax=Dactylellina haptotyla (strain CBS 200.50) TaxID=1284197 RepID=S8ALV3_DACHA|nr:hypothetical protein H072_3846 [Dactylellina haptotyla CBS 200.50]